MPASVFNLVDFPFCRVLTFERWDAKPGRYYLAYRTLRAYRHLLGHPVVDEYRTVSSPIFFTAEPLLGKIYNVGISLGEKRGPKMDLDKGWPPLCVGLKEPAPKLPRGWDRKLLDAVSGGPVPKTTGEKQFLRWRRDVAGFTLERWQFGDEVTVFGTTAPLLPEQLERVCQQVEMPLTMAMATGNHITRTKPTGTQTIKVVSDQTLQKLLDGAKS